MVYGGGVGLVGSPGVGQCVREYGWVRPRFGCGGTKAEARLQEWVLVAVGLVFSQMIPSLQSHLWWF